MLEILCFDICAIFILLILVFSLKFKKTIADEAGKRLLKLIAFTIIAAFLDIAANICNGRVNLIEINYLISGLFFIARNTAFYYYALYIISITGTWHKIGNKALKAIRLLPLIIIAIVVLVAPYSKSFYYYNESGYYVRGNSFIVIYVCNAIYCVFALYYIIKNIKLIGIGKTLSLMSCATFSFIATLIQFTNPSAVVDMVGFTLSLLLIVLFIDNYGDKIESTSNLLTYQTYIKDLRKIFYIRKPVDIIHINISNHKTIEEMLSYTNYLEFVRQVSQRLSDDNDKTKSLGDLYYLKNGKFRVILSDNDLVRTEALAKLILESFNDEISINGMAFTMETSLCITSCPEDFDYFSGLIEFGSVAACFEKPGIIVYSKDILGMENYNSRLNMSKQVEQGLVNGRFELFYQPVYNIETDSFTEVEALLRLHDEDNHIWVPEVFLPIAEQGGSIVEIGKFVMEEVCKFISSKEFEEAGIKKVGVNLSVVQCLQKDLTKQVLAAIEKYNISPEKIRFEITESLASDNQKTFVDNIKHLSLEGIAFALDDYGTGYSNITTLSTLPLDTIKFDESLASEVENEKLKAIFENSVAMVKSLGKKIVIEGVESKSLADRFISLGCDYMQGTYFAKPMTKARLIEFFEKQGK